jgi:hypothetical protein
MGVRLFQVGATFPARFLNPRLPLLDLPQHDISWSHLAVAWKAQLGSTFQPSALIETAPERPLSLTHAHTPLQQLAEDTFVLWRSYSLQAPLGCFEVNSTAICTCW